MTPLRCTRWTESDLSGGREVWQSLLAQSGADPLFMSWQWICCWWRNHAASLEAELRLYAIRDGNDEVIGIAPFYLHPARHGRWVGARRLQLIGASWRAGVAAFSEYLDILALPSCREPVAMALAAQLAADGDWDELVLANIRRDSAAELLGDAMRGDVYLRHADEMHAWALGVPEDFQQFVGALDSNTRRRVFNQRQKLPDAEYRVQSPSEWPALLDRLDGFLAHRWGGEGGGIVREFHEDLINSLPDAQVRLSTLTSAGKLVSVMLNLRAMGTEYYLQSGFDASFAQGTSPGYLHLGYAIEAATRDGMRRFDLLAGHGLHRDYKRDVAGEATPMRTLHLVRKQPLRALFRVADLLRGRTTITSPGAQTPRAMGHDGESVTLSG